MSRTQRGPNDRPHKPKKDTPEQASQAPELDVSPDVRNEPANPSNTTTIVVDTDAEGIVEE